MKNTLSDFVYNYYMQHKGTLQTYKTPKELYTQFKPGETEWNELVGFAKKDTIDITSVSASSKAELLKLFPVMLARQVWRTEGYFEVSNENDPVIKKALDVLK
jgi:carboxyl-terminal processing protease